MDEVQALEAALEEEEWLHRDTLEAAVLDQRSSRHNRERIYRAFSAVSVTYLLLDLLSRRVPGPAHWIGLDEHVQLFHRIGSLF